MGGRKEQRESRRRARAALYRASLLALLAGCYPLKGMIAETIVYQRKLADPETALVHAYLKARYGL
jgi:hypothetical protein